MKNKKISISEFLTERKEIIKPDVANTLNLGRVKKIDFSGNIHLEKETITNTNMIRIKNNDLLISGINAEKGAISVYKSPDDILASIHYSSYAFDKEIIWINYFKWFLKSGVFVDLLNKQIAGGIKKELKSKHILPLVINLPSLEIQKKISNELDFFEKRFDILRYKISTNLNNLENLSKSILQDAIQGKLIKCKNNSNIENIFKNIIEDKKILHLQKKIKKANKQDPLVDTDNEINIPKNWKFVELDNLSTLITDGTHQTPTYINEGRPFLSAQNIKPFKFMPEIHRCVTEKAHQDNIKNKKPEKGDILVGRVGNVGQAAVIDQNIEFSFYVSIGLIKLLKKYVLPEYIVIVFNSPYGDRYAHHNTTSKGAAAGNFNLGRIRAFKIPFTSIDEQKKIVKKVKVLRDYNAEMFKNITELNNKSRKLFYSYINKNFR